MTRTARSLARTSSLYAGADLGPYGLGGRRTRRDYERLVGRRLCDEPGIGGGGAAADYYLDRRAGRDKRLEQRRSGADLDSYRG